MEIKQLNDILYFAKQPYTDYSEKMITEYCKALQTDVINEVLSIIKELANEPEFYLLSGSYVCNCINDKVKELQEK